MKNKRIYNMDLYEVQIASRIGHITVEYFEGSNFFLCKFINDSYSDFINSYESFGFYADRTSALTKFIVNGKFDQNEAMKVWEQIERKEKPIDSKYFSVDF